MAVAVTSPTRLPERAVSADSTRRGTDVWYRRWVVATTATVYLLIVVGATVRVTGSGLGCGNEWPTCNGQWTPPATLEGWIEWTHRAIAGIVSPLILGTVVGAWLYKRRDSQVLVLATIVPVLLAIQVVLGKLVVEMDLAAMAVLVHLGFALVIFGLLVWLSLATAPAPALDVAAVNRSTGTRFRPLVGFTTAWMFALLLVGAYVRASGATWACTGFPECNNQGLLPFGRNQLMDIQLLHRLMAYVAIGLVGWLAIGAARSQRHLPSVRASTRLLSLAIVFQATIGAVAVSTSVPPLLQAAHVAGAAATWGAMMGVACLAFRTRGPRYRAAPVSADVLAASETGTFAAAARAYLELTKPRVMSLLLLTTLGAMVIAAQGMPDQSLMFWTLVGGALMSGGAGAINHYLDRDIDPLMGRTALRPIPSGQIRPRHALVFGLVLAAIAFGLFIVFVNVLAGILAVVGLVGYVFVYTLWLKRSSPSNIVIGGAAGAVPPLVGWAAVTNDIGMEGVGLTAWYLFAIVFFWTPPHFWALSLLIKQHYERANIPMLPVVRGDAETRWQILLYSVLLVALTLVLFSFRLMGLLYLVSAAALGGIFIYLAVRLWREASAGAARRLYLYSILYLAALFVSMAVDRVAFRQAIS